VAGQLHATAALSSGKALQGVVVVVVMLMMNMMMNLNEDQVCLLVLYMSRNSIIYRVKLAENEESET
jgi:hypothetical protein